MEQRTMERYDLPLRVFLSFADGPSRELTTNNISGGGAFLATDITMRLGSEVYLSIFPGSSRDWVVDQEKIIRLQGEVLRQNVHGVAIRFHEHQQFNNCH